MDPGTRKNRAEEADLQQKQQEEEEVDPRIQGELEKLNQSTDDINRRETELEAAKHMKVLDSRMFEPGFASRKASNQEQNRITVIDAFKKWNRNEE